MNIKEYEQKLQNYTQEINKEKENIASAERAIIVSQTQLKNYQEQLASLENECQSLTGKPITDIELVIEENMKQLEEAMSKVQAAKSVSDNLNVMTDEELKDSMQFMVEDEF